jgi:uncharacterized membrane protein
LKRKKFSDQGLDYVLSNILRYGVITSSIVIAIGAGLTIAGVRSDGLPASISQLIQSNYDRPTLDAAKLFSGIASLDGGSIIQLGLIILLATPILRVLASVLIFGAEKDMIFVGITVFVLAVLLFSIFVVGPIESAG